MKDTNQDLALLRHAFADLIEIRSMLDELVENHSNASEASAKVWHPIDRIQALVWKIGDRLGEF
jgi:hypothetical protein